MAGFKQRNRHVSGQIDVSLGHFAKELKSDALRDEFRTGWSIALLYRAPGVVAAWVAARLGLTPLVVSMLAFGVALLMPVIALWLPLTVAPMLLMLAGVAFQVLDCADGTLARGTNTTSVRGGDLDFLIDMAQWGLLYLAIGILADRLLGSGWGWATLGMMAGWGRLLARVIRDRLDDGIKHAVKALRPVDYPVVFIEGLSGLIPFLALSGQWLGTAVIALMIYSLIDIIDAALPLTKP